MYDQLESSNNCEIASVTIESGGTSREKYLNRTLSESSSDVANVATRGSSNCELNAATGTEDDDDSGPIIPTTLDLLI